jgi:hypothetical protein
MNMGDIVVVVQYGDEVGVNSGVLSIDQYLAICQPSVRASDAGTDLL